MKSNKKILLVIITLMVLVMAGIGIYYLETRENKNLKDANHLTDVKGDAKTDDKQSDDKSTNDLSNDDETNGDVDNSLKDDELNDDKNTNDLSDVDETNEGGTSNYSEPSSETTNSYSDNSNNSVQNNQIDNSNNNVQNNQTNNSGESVDDNSLPIEQDVTDDTNIEDDNSQILTQEPDTPKNEDDNVHIDNFFDSITGRVKEYATSNECVEAGYAIMLKDSSATIAYNKLHMDNPIDADIKYFNCLEVIDENGSGWFLDIKCSSGNCNEKYK